MSPAPAVPQAILPDYPALRAQIAGWALELGFTALGVSGIELPEDAAHLSDWLAQGQHGGMEYMSRHAALRCNPDALHPGTLRVISVRMDYWPESAHDAWQVLGDGTRAYIARYALGRDYHGLMRKRLQALADRIAARIGAFGYRAFVDSAPVLEKALARNAGLGWIGKHTLLLSREAGSYFFLGELFTDLPLPIDAEPGAHCGSCSRCIDICPTQAIVAPRRLDARRCIAYLTIEHKGAIPEELRPMLGNRVFGCDDCQLVCPWNRYARASTLPDFAPRHGLDAALLCELIAWDEATWNARTEGMALRRAGYAGWLRNLAVALGNAPHSARVMQALAARAQHASALVREHVAWALATQQQKAARGVDQGNNSEAPVV
ncbi:MAG: tRNA epoxyqueuosine(34) reductase QueG [Proteobacteria bacterium]|nr:tRNA epoxyqueuosine(34) reductase QueG [Pseudomonadota bacterium]